MCKAPIKSSTTTNQHPTVYRPDALYVAEPTVSIKTLKEKPQSLRTSTFIFFFRSLARTRNFAVDLCWKVKC